MTAPGETEWEEVIEAARALSDADLIDVIDELIAVAELRGYLLTLGLGGDWRRKRDLEPPSWVGR